MAIVHEGFSVTLQPSNSTSVTGSEPSGTASGDLLIALVSCDGNRTISANTEADWLAINATRSDGTVSLRAFAHQRGASAPDLQFNFSGSETAVLGISRVTGYNTADPYDFTNNVTGSSVSPIAPSITMSIGETELLFRFFASDRDRITEDTGYPAGLTGQYIRQSTTGAAACALGLATHIRSSSDGARTFTDALSTADGWVGWSFGIKQAAAADVPDPGFLAASRRNMNLSALRRM